ncbi:MAG: Re/Si-specific NAD(P)(+) transhydrogenase subunit alpha [Bacteroidetes bacterium]|jgi:NAD(P) transhydrogenase subunit alpha|nr:Re/Si-specific NAD(P)(+) transhydrogenase subunit alpha [Bacteroidota bacterium]
MPVIGVLKETAARETRVALVPQSAGQLVKEKHGVLVQSGAGAAAGFSDADYQKAGAKIVASADAVIKGGDLIVKVQPPSPAEVKKLRANTALISFLSPATNAPLIKALAGRKVTAFAMEYIPRISRAQSMDALSSMATVAGYKAVLMAASEVGKMYPMLMTAAGTISPATVLVLGVGVAGLQAIATAKRLGAKVEAFDPRPAVKDQVKSLGAAFVEMELPKEDVETKGGYAKEQSDAFLKAERVAIAARLPKVNALITTAQIFGKKAPVLVTADMVKQMPPGSVILDMAAESGGNCELTVAGKTVIKHGVKIIGAVNLPALLPVDASNMYSRNVYNLLKHMYPKADAPTDPSEEILAASCLTRGGAVVNEAVRALLVKGGE